MAWLALRRKSWFLRNRRRFLGALALLCLALPLWVNFRDWRDVTKYDLNNNNNNNNNNRKVLWMMSYMRSGSSFIARTLFDTNPDIYFVFEPLAPLYTAMYGVEMNMVVDTDITTNIDGSLRRLPTHERDSLLWTLDQIFSCRMTSLPVTMYSHIFWAYWHWTWAIGETYAPCLKGQLQDEVKQTNEVNSACLKNSGAHMGHTMACWGKLKPVCGQRINQPDMNQDLCYQELFEPFYKSGFKQPIVFNFSSSSSVGDNEKNGNVGDIEGNEDMGDNRGNEDDDPFHEFRHCWPGIQRAIQNCSHHFQTPCEEREIMAVKTVRATMDVAEPMLKKHPELYILYLYRDPRSVTRSRKNFWWSQGLFDKGNVTLIARAYCQRVVADLQEKARLDNLFPGQIMTYSYDEFAENSMQSAKTMYDFFGMEFNEQSVWDYLSFRRKEKDPLKVRDKWKEELSADEVESIQKECAHFASEVGFSWNK